MRINRENAHNEYVEKVPHDSTHRNYRGHLPLRQPEIVQSSFPEAYFCSSSHKYLIRPFSTASTPEIRCNYTYVCYFVGAQAKEKLSTCSRGIYDLYSHRRYSSSPIADPCRAWRNHYSPTHGTGGYGLKTFTELILSFHHVPPRFFCFIRSLYVFTSFTLFPPKLIFS
jgi:hypothetical protein